MNAIGELRYAFRALWKSPVFTAVAVVSLALGIGANTAVFTLLDQMILRLLPVKDAAQIIQLREDGPFYGSNTGMNSLSYPLYKDLSEQNQVFSGMLCRGSLALSVSSGGQNQRAMGEMISGTYFPVLGIRPAAGRLFTPEDDRARSAAPYAVLGYSYWQAHFAGDHNIIGKQILVNNHHLTVVGVAADGFQGVDPLYATEIFIPIMMSAEITAEEKPFDDRQRRWLQVFARLKPGVTATDAAAALQPNFHRIIQDETQQAAFAKASSYSKAQYVKMRLLVMPGGRGQSEARAFLEAPLWALMGMVGLVLLIACANVANLMIARAASRQKEIAVRLAVGASRLQIVRQLCLESGIVALLGGALGLLLSTWALTLLEDVIPQMDPPIVFFSLLPDLRVLLFTLIASVATAVLFGLLPALQATRPDLAPTLKDQGGAVAGGQAIWRKVLVCAQVSLSLLLLIGAGLFVGTLRNLKASNPGFEVTNLLSFAIDPTLNGYNTGRAKLLYRQLADNLRALPGVHETALCVVAPLSYDEWDSTISIEGYAHKQGEDMNPNVNYISPGFFDTFKIPILSGRDFSDRDVLGSPKIAIVNEKFANRYFRKESPIGRHIGMGDEIGSKTDIEIVGVVRDMKYQNMRDDPPREVFFPYQQNKWARQMSVYVRTDLPPQQMFGVLRAAVRKLDPNLPVFLMKTEQRQMDDVLSAERLTASLSAVFGVVATVLAAIGLYGVMAFLVTRRTREIGLRMALGADRSHVLWIVLREVLMLVGIGTAIGLPAALAVCNLIRSQLYGMSPFDPVTIVSATLGIILVAAVSGYVPALRATRVDPMIALRYE